MTAPAVILPGTLCVDVVADRSGRTRASTLHQRYPQRVTVPLHCDPARPHAATLCVQSPSGGTFSDDELTTTVSCRPGTQLHLTTQSATQVFAGDGPGAQHRLTFNVDADALLEYCPGTVIPHAASAFTQRVVVDVATGGAFFGWEALAAGRIAHGERFGFARYDSAFAVRVDGRAVARDRQLLRPQGGRGGSLVDGDYLATFVAVVPGHPIEALLQDLRCALDGNGGASRLPAEAGVFVRVMLPHATALRRIRDRLFAACRAWSQSAACTRASEETW
ncbi:urease accessory protein UreD [Mycobacterium sp. smrl_JER01]|uniref:urease accessory protein UreD n=1 Tax=Mycobacterium sp. smrl_JER01 TaxID=3402633 RepID=UPI003AC121C9